VHMAFEALAFAVLAVFGAGGQAAASTWCGENGLFRFSFVEGDTIVESLVTGEPQGGVTIIDVTAWLSDMDPVARNGDAFLRLGGAELKLKITGAEASIIAQDFFDPRALSIGSESGNIVVGFHPGLRCGDGYVKLVHWKVLFQGRPTNVRVGLDGTGLRSCETQPGCPESGTLALYVGADAANQLECIFGAGYVPAWVNPDGEQDTTPVTGKVSWRDVGVFKAR
jgi:hypothetical protein